MAMYRVELVMIDKNNDKKDTFYSVIVEAANSEEAVNIAKKQRIVEMPGDGPANTWAWTPQEILN